MLDDLFTYRLARGPLPDGHERVEPREGPRVVRASTPTASTSSVRRPRSTTTRCSPCRGRGRARSSQRSPTGELPARMRTAELQRRRRAGARVRHRLHGRGRRRAAARARRRAGASGTRWSTPGVDAGRASARATRCASRSASTSTATTCRRTATRSRPASAGAASSTPASSAPRRCRGARGRPGRALVPFALHRPGHPAARATRCVRRRRGRDERHASPCLERRDRHGVRAGRARRAPGTRSRSTCAASRARPRSRRSRSTERRDLSGRRELPRGPAATTPSTTGRGSRATGHVRDHLVRAGRARRGRVLRPARGRHAGDARTRPTPRSSR